ncbi:hypothetical protein [Paraburkholderia azotifigens]|uniref:Uncharacterized protein n=1 Tax=Paraburkholderia azotifigens TaxID=2057004 RepID=A0A5C6V8V4_9BURK|nr:hypothetical protein [Paraburkholderia azotifigens]TXC80125.1 hypothetical protein FRZ40_38115 [Paraburkholderia azotifigens]
MSASDYKRELMFRRAQGKLCAERYSRKIAHFLNHTVRSEAFSDLKKTDEIINELSTKIIIYSDNIKINSESEMIAFINQSVDQSGFYLLIDEEWRFCGAYEINGEFEFNANFNFDDNLSDEIRIIDINFLFQIQLDYDSDEITCLYLQY